jgi:DNA-binding transcriptional ArsR family regulator
MQPKIKIVTDPKKAKALASETRLRILQEIASNPQSISQIAKKLSITPVAVHYHIKKLASAGFINLSEEKIVNNNLTEKFYKLANQEYLVAVSGESPTKGPVPPKSSETLLLGITPYDVEKLFELLELTYSANDKAYFETETIKILQKFIREAGFVQREILSELKLKLSPADRLKLEYAAMAVLPIALDRLLQEPESLERLRRLTGMLQKSG